MCSIERFFFKKFSDAGLTLTDHQPLLSEKSSTCMKCGRAACWLFTFILVLVLLIFCTIWWLYATSTPSSAFGYYSHAAVASDSRQCSEIGRDVLQENGSAVDAAIATLFCIGIHCAHSAGIGGGFHMVVHLGNKSTSWAIDARETAPASAVPAAFVNKSLPLTGALSIGVPGEVLGYYRAWSRFGRLPWRRLVQPTIDLCRNGYRVEYALAETIKELESLIRQNSGLRKLFVKPDGSLYQEGDTMVRPDLAKTLDIIAHNATEFYYGSLARDVLNDLREIGANISQTDLEQYQVREYDALMMPLKNGEVIHSLRPPSSGALLGFMLRVLEGFNLTENDFRRIATYQKIVETFKFSYSLRTYLGDETFVNISEIMQNVTSSEFADYIRSRINVSYTQPLTYYNPAYLLPPDDKGTSHVAVLAPDGSAVSVTSTINSKLGSKQVGSRTGIIFNDEIDDFLLPNKFPHPPVDGQPVRYHFANEVAPGKRPMSSMCPAIVLDQGGRVNMVIGAAGSTLITSATAYVSAHTLWLGRNMKKAVDELRLHHQLQPDVVQAERHFPKEPLQALRAKGHHVSFLSDMHAVVSAIHSTCGRHSLSDASDYRKECILAVSDWRKRGAPSGF